MQIAQQIRKQIETGVIAKGERLPSAKGLAVSLEVNSNTVLQAYRYLRDRGIIDLRRGRGAVAISTVAQSDPVMNAIGELVTVAQTHDLTLAQVTELLSREGLK